MSASGKPPISPSRFWFEHGQSNGQRIDAPRVTMYSPRVCCGSKTMVSAALTTQKSGWQFSLCSVVKTISGSSVDR